MFRPGQIGCSESDDDCNIKIIKIILYNINIYYINIQGGPKVSTHTLGLIPPPCFIFEGCCFADGILYLFVREFRH